MKKILSLIIFGIISINILLSQDVAILSLEDAIKTGLENNFGISIQKKNIEITTVSDTWGNAGALPSVSFVSNETGAVQQIEDKSYNAFTSNSSVNLNWTIFRGFAVKIQKEKLEKYRELSEVALQVTVENTILGIVSAYYMIVLNNKNVEIAEELMNLSEDRYTLAQKRVELGSSTTFDMLQAKNSFYEDKANLLNAKANYKLAVRQLNHLLTVDLDTVFSYEKDINIDTGVFVIDSLESKMLSNNFTLRNQYINLELSKLDIRNAKSAFYPSLSLRASTGYNYSKTNQETNPLYPEPDLDNLSASLTLSLNYSIFEGNRRKIALQVAEIQEEITALKIDDYKLELLNQLHQELDMYNIRKEMIIVAKEKYETNKLNFELSKKRFDNGTINSFNFRDIKQMFFVSAVSYQNAIYNLMVSYNNLLRLTGGMVETYQ